MTKTTMGELILCDLQLQLVDEIISKLTIRFTSYNNYYDRVDRRVAYPALAAGGEYIPTLCMRGRIGKIPRRHINRIIV